MKDISKLEEYFDSLFQEEAIRESKRVFLYKRTSNITKLKLGNFDGFTSEKRHKLLNEKKVTIKTRYKYVMYTAIVLGLLTLISTILFVFCGVSGWFIFMFAILFFVFIMDYWSRIKNYVFLEFSIKEIKFQHNKIKWEEIAFLYEKILTDNQSEGGTRLLTSEFIICLRDKSIYRINTMHITSNLDWYIIFFRNNFKVPINLQN